jgi:hypothetical protein
MLTALLLVATTLLVQQPAPAAQMNELEKQFQATLTNASLVGFFTVGDSPEARPDKYTIENLTKVDGDTWKIDARIQYGGKDYSASVNIPVKWAGDTAVMSMAQYAIAGQGVFSARILIHEGMYAGTWGNQKTGGKMFGMIVKNTAPAAAPPR